ncbi:MAG: NUDIX domain-containing protein [Bacteroidota bacterium]
MYKVFMNDKPLVICDSQGIPAIHDALPKAEYDGPKWLAEKALALEQDPEAEGLIVLAEKPSLIWEVFQSGYRFLEAAGGLVATPQAQYLFIFRHGKWDLPKGKLEKKESIRQGAVREVVEECGIPEPAVSGLLTATYHTYQLKGKPILKRTHWFAMQLDHPAALIPQTEEGITDVRWLDEEGLSLVLGNTYRTIAEVLHLGIPRLKG